MTIQKPIRLALIDPRLLTERGDRALAPAPRRADIPRNRLATPLRVDSGNSTYFLRSRMIGTLGIVVDTGALFGLIERFDVAPLPARVVSILIAITVTWLLHWRWTFNSSDSERLAEWGRFLTESLGGAATNCIVYAAVLLALPGTPPLLALAMGCGAALAGNHAKMRLWPLRGVAARMS